MAYTTKMAAALSGATVSQLRHWRRETPAGVVLEPEIATSPTALYSFRDVLALRTCVRLRQLSSLQRVRKAIGNLRDLGEREHLSQYKLVSDGTRIQLVTDEDAVDLTGKPGQRQLVVVMGEIVEPFPIRAGVVIPHLFHPNANVEVDPATQGGHPVVRGTRVPYDLVAELVDDGVAPEKISDFYPAVSADAARDAVAFARYVNSYDLPRRAA
ncbi:DUF433 domain-containing protein [Actinomadura barringtoniae]|uniref:DUF433 domain-containing protein n=1 Tax=Actinomadura barringtoniae TaxID=1427535 RepID=A0A939PSX7_9ACTN|nr:DUF433 domain-containing protein [Actinomadura barringtoniae]MBO2454201.1 DUF433 domain-containing protein [Actinomadura barringtoniae]